ncbi:hypothetical protein PG984_013008 [Apiospora sp. TS-2023a]
MLKVPPVPSPQPSTPWVEVVVHDSPSFRGEGPVDDGGAGLEVARVGLLQRDGVVPEEAAVVVLGVVGGLGLVGGVGIVVGVCCCGIAGLGVVTAANAEAAACRSGGRGDRGRCEEEGQCGGHGELHVGRLVGWW